MTEPIDPFDLHCYRKTATVFARKTMEDGEVETPEGVMRYHAGDYLVTDNACTHQWPVRRDIFEATYELVW